MSLKPCGSAFKRLKRELKELEENPPAQWSGGPANDDVLHWSATILGPDGSPYEDGVFVLDIKIPADYPFKGPTVVFITKIYHPNISEGGGMSRVPDLYLNWQSPSLTISKLLQSIHLMLAEPNPHCPLRVDCARQYQSDKPAFERAAREHTAKYAVPANKLGEAALKRLRSSLLESFEAHAVTREAHAAECQAHAAEA